MLRTIHQNRIRLKDVAIPELPEGRTHGDVVINPFGTPPLEAGTATVCPAGCRLASRVHCRAILVPLSRDVAKVPVAITGIGFYVASRPVVEALPEVLVSPVADLLVHDGPDSGIGILRSVAVPELNRLPAAARALEYYEAAELVVEGDEIARAAADAPSAPARA